MTAATTPGLRERKKQQTRSQLHRAALAMVLQHGLEHVTVEQIAAQAQVSTRTFFNYFPTKDAAIAGADPELPAQVLAQFEARPAKEGVLTSLETVLGERLSRLAADAALRRQRTEVFRRWPELVAAAAGTSTGVEQALRTGVARRMAVDLAQDLRPAFYVACATAVVRAALITPGVDLYEALAAGFAALRAGLPDEPADQADLRNASAP